jgi:hypothetical protein
MKRLLVTNALAYLLEGTLKRGKVCAKAIVVSSCQSLNILI